MRNLAAHTAPGGSYPPFISINEVDKGISFYVREPAGVMMHDGLPCPREGAKAAIVLDRSTARRLLEQALARLPR